MFGAGCTFERIPIHRSLVSLQRKLSNRKLNNHASMPRRTQQPPQAPLEGFLYHRCTDYENLLRVWDDGSGRAGQVVWCRVFGIC